MDKQIAKKWKALRKERQYPVTRGKRAWKRLKDLHLEYLKRRETSLLDAAGAALSVSALRGDVIDVEAMPDRVQEAFHLAFPHMSWADFAAHDSPENLISAWKGKLFEVEVRDRLNAGEWVGDRHLSPGQVAVLADSPTQAGWDLQILDGTGLPLEEIQLKASDSVSYLKRALETYPDIAVIATDDTSGYDEIIEGLSHADISEDDLRQMVEAPIEPLLDSAATDVAEAVLPFLPFVIIALQNGRKVMTGRTTCIAAAEEAAQRLRDTGISVVAGWLASSYLGDPFGVLTAFAVRMGIRRAENMKAADESMRIALERVRCLLPAPGNVST